jgi:translation elongation factor EF-G
VFCCSAYHNQGVKEVLDEVVDILPSPVDVPAAKGKAPGNDTEVTVAPTPRHPRRDRIQDPLRAAPRRPVAPAIYSGHVEAGKDL